MLPETGETNDILCAYEHCTKRWTISLNAKRGYCSSHAWVLLHDQHDPRKPARTEGYMFKKNIAAEDKN